MMRIFTLIITFGFLLGASSLLAGDEPSAAAAREPAITAPPGFVVEAIFKVPSSAMGSWASLTVDAQGRLIASDEGNKGVFLITLPALDAQDASATVEKLPIQVGGAQGLLWAFDSLYLHCDGG